MPLLRRSHQEEPGVQSSRMEPLRWVVALFLLLGTALALCEQVFPTRRGDVQPPTVLPSPLLVDQQRGGCFPSSMRPSRGGTTS